MILTTKDRAVIALLYEFKSIELCPKCKSGFIYYTQSEIRKDFYSCDNCNYEEPIENLALENKID
jgi:DNA-directed RNA polymerase subunit M/transcription elongation factor TFIIS